MKHINVSLFVPFLGCPHRCSFCDQKAITGQETSVTPADVVRAAQTAVDSGVDTTQGQIAFFGGSFTMLQTKTMVSLLESARPFVENGLFSGIRISTRPDAIDADVLSLLKQYHVTAIELGCQSTDDRVLKRNERGHTRTDIANACALIRQSDMELGVQMMTGLPGDCDAGAIQTANDLISFGAQTARIYPTLVLKGTRLAQWWQSGDYAPQTLDAAVELCAKLLHMFETAKVPVIRLGLHAQSDLQQNLLAGPYHPAFRELCEGKRYLDAMQTLLSGRKKGDYILTVNSRALSKAAGQNRRNLRSLQQAGYHIRLRGDDKLALYEIQG